MGWGTLGEVRDELGTIGEVWDGSVDHLKGLALVGEALRGLGWIGGSSGWFGTG